MCNGKLPKSVESGRHDGSPLITYATLVSYHILRLNKKARYRPIVRFKYGLQDYYARFPLAGGLK